MKEIHTSDEVKRAELEVELSNQKLSHALDRLKVRSDITVAALRRFGRGLRSATQPIALASGAASRSRVFAWGSLGVVGLLSGFGVKKAYERYSWRRLPKLPTSTLPMESGEI